jgi:valyl-tRNA synthetase
MSKSLGNTIDPLQIIDGASLDSMTEQIRASSLMKESEKAKYVEEKCIFILSKYNI